VNWYLLLVVPQGWAGNSFLSLLRGTVRFRVRVSLRLAVYSQSVRLGANTLKVQDKTYFLTDPLRSYSLRNILSDERMGLRLMNRLVLFKGYALHIELFIENSSFCTICKPSLSPGF
jgi:hypothetical protein